MKVLLVQLFSGSEEGAIYPLGLGYLATALTAHEVRIFDQNLYDNPYGETEKILLDFSPDVVGVSLRNVRIFSTKERRHLTYREALRETVRIIIRTAPKAIIVIGGPGFSMFPVRILEDEPEIDFGVFLEAEASFPRLLENVDSPTDVKGVFYRNGKDVVFSGGCVPVQFDTFAEPRRDLLDPKRYIDREAIGVQSKRGCCLKCIYCSYPFISGNTLRLRSPKDVVAEIRNLLSNYGVRNFTFADNVFNVPAAHAKEICRAIVNQGLDVRWTAWFDIKFIDEELLDLALAAGCRGIELSPDGYSNRSLEWLKKGFSTKQINQTYRLIRKRPQLKVGYNFMLGIPGQGIFSLVRFALFVLKLRICLKGQLRWVHVNRVKIEPNTELERIAVEQGYIRADTDLRWTHFYQVGTAGLVMRLRRSVRLSRCAARLLKKGKSIQPPC